MFTNHINIIRSGFIVGAIAALLFALPSGLFCSKLTAHGCPIWKQGGH